MFQSTSRSGNGDLDYPGVAFAAAAGGTFLVVGLQMLDHLLFFECFV